MSKQPDDIRILHTADWHLGREFHGADLTEAHLHLFDWLADEVERLEVDVIVMAGDIYDRALPPASSVELLNRQLARLSELCEVVLIAGNHDSMARLSHGPLLKPEIHLAAGPEVVGRPIEIPNGKPGEDPDEDSGEPSGLLIYPVPYLDPGITAKDFDTEARHQAVLAAAFDRCREDLVGRGEGYRTMAVAHAFVQGAEESESERTISIGTADRVPTGTLDGFDYVALGHLHRPQQVAPAMRYSGSPIPLSYSEVDYGPPKSVVIVDFPPTGDPVVETVEVPQHRKFERISGTLEDLLNDQRFEDCRESWLEVTVTDETRPDQPMDRLRTRFSNVMSLRFSSPISSAEYREAEQLGELARVEPEELAARFVEEVRGSGPDDAERALFEEAVRSKQAEEVAG
jgi:exonuclease SbcD